MIPSPLPVAYVDISGSYTRARDPFTNREVSYAMHAVGLDVDGKRSHMWVDTLETKGEAGNVRMLVGDGANELTGSKASAILHAAGVIEIRVSVPGQHQDNGSGEALQWAPASRTMWAGPSWCATPAPWCSSGLHARWTGSRCISASTARPPTAGSSALWAA